MRNNFNWKTNKASKRIISFITALVMFGASLPVSDIKDVFDVISSLTKPINATAYDPATTGEPVRIGSPSELITYSKNYTSANQNDTLIINFADSSTSGEFEGFVSIGTDAAPFNGKIKIADNMTLNLPEALFGCVTDDVQIVENNNSDTPATLILTRTQNPQGDALFARKVVKCDSPSLTSPVQWKIKYDRFYDPNSSDTQYFTYDIAGVIGEMGAGASVKLLDLTYNNDGGNGTSGVRSSGDAGLLCCTMGAGATLEVGTITMESGYSSTAYSVESASSGNAGGLVGSMGNGAKLILGSSFVNPQYSGQAITAAGGYAGGIVGYVDGGSIEIGGSSYTVSQVITGSSGAGGIAGYYNTTVTDNNVKSDPARYTISTDNVSIGSSCKVNGVGNCGGLFGEVVNNGTMTISGDTAVSPDHSAGKGATDTGYGALIGKYSASDQTNSLTISTTATHQPQISGGSAYEYGGLIGIIGGASYVDFDDSAVNASNAAKADHIFGGLVGRCVSGFVELTGTNTISVTGSYSASHTFGGVVGSLDNGVLYLQGTTDLRSTPGVSTAAASSGQIVGNRDTALIFADTGWTLQRSTNEQTLDDVGSWGEVVRFTYKNNGAYGYNSSDGTVVTVDPTNHYVTLASAVTSMTNTTDFVRTALNAQLNKAQTTGVLRCSGTTGENLLESTSSLSLSGNSVKVDLSGTGITGLTRDNGSSLVTFAGTFNGNGGSIKLAVGESYQPGSNTEGNGRIYRHKLIGLFGKTNGANIQDLNISADSSIDVYAIEGMHVGNVIGQATGNLALTNVEICSDNTPSAATISIAGSNSTVGGLVGDIIDGETVAISNCTYNGVINATPTIGNASGTKIAGFVGCVHDSNGGDRIFAISVSGTVSGSITAASGNEIGGTIAVISATGNPSSYPSRTRTLKINDLDINGLSITSGGACGGFLGYEWHETDVEFKNSGSTGVTVTSSSITADSAEEGSGLVGTATGYWKVNAGGIDLDSMTISEAAAASFGLIVNKGYDDKDKSAIYLELADGAYIVGDSDYDTDISLSLAGVTVFDELVAYSANGSVLSNGQGIVSIATPGHALLKMDSYGGTANTYQHKTKFLEDNSGLINNPHTRYYYNLDQYRTSQSDGAQELLIWSVDQYAHTTLKYYFSETSTISSDADLSGYSHYPVDLTGSLTISGKVTLRNAEFDTTETATNDGRISTDSAQHYLIHNSLLRNVSGTLNFSGSLDGTVKQIGEYCGALVMGTVGSSAFANPAKINISSLSLDGIRIANFTTNGYYPLLINKASSNAKLDVKNVSNTNKYSSMGAGASTPSYIASSLLGDIGSEDATGVELKFSLIKLDGRNAAGVTNLSSLDSVYNSKGSLFDKATLVNKLQYKADSGSQGVYNYTYAQDWGGTRQVTYGAEVENSTEHHDKEHWYNGGWDTPQYTRPDSSSNIRSQYTSFDDYFLNYVKTAYNSSTGTHELRVNIKSATFGGCGTYNDPYLITDGTQLKTIADIIAGLGDSTTFTIAVPEAVDAAGKNETWCEDKTDGTHHRVYTSFTHYSDDRSANIWSDGNGHTLSDAALGQYLAGAYYKINPDLEGDIDLPSDFSGLSNSVSGEEYVFRGVIDGSGKTINNPTSNPLIANSNGSVVYNLDIVVNPASAKKITNPSGSSSKFSFSATNKDNCDSYGAVIGKIFGGDNIIDDVSVDFGDRKIIDKNNAGNAYLVPIGGYVGVVINGGLIFRNMNGLADQNQGGLTADNLTGFGSFTYTDDDGQSKTTTDPTSSKNTKWLYVNPIVGRVLNGYAITESSSFKPFEDGSRKYPDGSVEYWDETGVTDSKDDAVGVTMRNGTKNYSIADIDKDDTNSFAMNGSDITIFSAQALYIMSLITQSGLGKSTNGKYKQLDDLKPYDKYMATHLADYTNLGTATIASDTDYSKAVKDVQYTEDRTAKIPYLIKTYTPESTGVYPAFNVMGDASYFYDLILEKNGEKTQTFYLPDSYRGLGSLMFGVVKANNFKLDEYKDNIVFINSLTGNGNTVSMSMRLRYYDSDNYTTMSGYQGLFKMGFALIDSLQSSEGDFHDLILRGSVNSERLLDTGVNVNYTAANVGKTSNPAVAAFVGVPVAGSGNMTFSNINVDGMDISGMCYAGGFVGALNIPATLTFTSCKADDLKVFAGGAAGGLIGYMRNKSAKVIADFGFTDDNDDFQKGTFGIISIISALNADNFDENNNGAGGAGGLIGYRKTGESSGIPSDQNITVSNVTIKNGSSKTDGGYIGYNKDGTQPNAAYISAGGVVGRADKPAVFSANNVSVENLNIAGKFSGGMIGYLNGEYSKATFTNCSVNSSTEVPCTISNTHSTDGASGGYIGKNEGPAASTITDSKLTGYTISGAQNVGGLIGYNNTLAALTLTNDELNGHTLSATSQDVGGLIGEINNGSVSGYNILVKNQTSPSISTRNGYIVGYNNSKSIKLVGFSRQGSVGVAKMVGNSSDAASESYGGGYVIFADYNDTASAQNPNKKFSNMQSVGENVVSNTPIGSRTVVTDYTVITQKDSVGNSIVKNISSEVTSDTTSDTPVSGLAEGNKNVTVSGNKLGYETEVASSDLQQVNTLAELTAVGNSGFYIKSKNDSNKFLTSELGIDASLEKAAKLYFEIIESENNYYGIYTYINGVKKYLSVKIDDNSTGEWVAFYTQEEANLLLANNSSRTWDRSFIVTSNFSNVNNQFQFKLVSTSGNNGTKNPRLYFRTNSSGKFCFAESNTKPLTIWQDPPAPSDIFVAKSYSATSFDPVVGQALSGTLTSGGTGTAAQLSEILSNGGYDSTDTSYEAYIVTKTVVENIYEPGDTPSPYVTTNPRYDTVTAADTQWLVSDGVSDTDYYGSAAQNILVDYVADSVPAASVPKAYKATGLDTSSLDLNNANNLQSVLVKNMKSIKNVSNAPAADYTGGADFPVLVVDDITTADQLVTNYLRLLTNTSYDFGSDNASVYNVDITKWKYDKSEGEFVKQSGDASLKRSGGKFSIKATEVDNENWQISLIDVQFYDPSDTSDSPKIAYHLYVPVVVKKMLHYTIQIRPASTTTYKLDAYPTTGPNNNVVENLGNPITMRITYTYRQSASDWESAINNGESVCRNYDKKLEFKNYGDLFPADAKLVLLDPNDNKDKYYYADFSSVIFSGKTDTTPPVYTMDLSSFTGYTKPYINDLLNITVNAEAEDKNLVECAANDANLVCIVRGGKQDGSDLPLRLKQDNETGAYAVSVSLKDNQKDNNGYVQEHYYLSIFTKEDPNKNDPSQMDTNIYHYEISRTVKTFGESDYPSADVGNTETAHLIIGNLYTNTITIEETNPNRLMGDSNLTLGANLTANLGFTANAISNDIETMVSNSNVRIYQSFMVGLNRLNGTGEANQRGILVDPVPGYSGYGYSIDGVDKDPADYADNTEGSVGLSSKIHSGYVEFSNTCNIKDLLKEAIRSTAGYAVIKETVTLGYQPTTLSAQFPKATASEAEGRSKGTYMIGYSNVASTSTGGAASRASANTDGTPRLCYYIDDDTTVEFSYNAVSNSLFAGDGNGNYGQLGLDGKELDSHGENYVQIKSAAFYNTADYNLISSAHYVKISVKLSKKSSYETALDIPTYLDDFEILDKDDNQITQVDDDPATTEENEGNDVTFDNTGNVYTFIVPKEMLKCTAGEYYIPINFKAYSGNNASFEQKNSVSNDMEYSNYKVLVTVGLLETNNLNESPLPNSGAQDHIIYTNAKLYSEVID